MQMHHNTMMHATDRLAASLAKPSDTPEVET